MTESMTPDQLKALLEMVDTLRAVAARLEAIDSRLAAAEAEVRALREQRSR